MPNFKLNAYDDPRDLLWRLAPAPFRCKLRVGQLPVLVESNDPQVLVALSKMYSEKSSDGEPTFQWRIIRDPEAGGEIEPVVLLADGDLNVLKMGTGVLAGVDKARKELLGFLGTCVSDQEFLECVAPLFVQLTLEAAREGARDTMGKMELALARGNGNA